MASKHHSPAEVLVRLRQVQVLAGQVVARIHAISEVGIIEQPLLPMDKAIWRQGGDQLNELNHFQNEN